MCVKHILSALLLLVVVGCTKDRTVIYAVACTSCTVRYLDAEQVAQQTTVNGQWSTNFEGTRGRGLWLNADNSGSGGPISLRISCAGRLLDISNATGDTSLSVNGKVPH